MNFCTLQFHVQNLSEVERMAGGCKCFLINSPELVSKSIVTCPVNKKHMEYSSNIAVTFVTVTNTGSIRILFKISI